MKTYKGVPMTISSKTIKLGDRAPNFKALDNNLEVVELSTFKDEYILLNVVPSLDTLICDMQTKTITEELVMFHKLKIITISNDLPFAQNRWCEKFKTNTTILSDYLYNDFGIKYGLLMDELKLLARAFIVLDVRKKVIYFEDVIEQGTHLNFDELINFLNTLPND